MKKFFFTIIICIVSISAVHAETVLNAITEDGRKVLLLSDGTWVFKPEKPTSSHAPEEGTVPDSAKAFLKGGRDSYVVYYDETRWKKSDADGVAEFELDHKNGDGYALIIYERIPIPLENLKNIALENAREAAPQVRIVEEKKKIVNGHEVLLLRMDGVIEGVPFTYLGYYASGNWGTVQFVTYTATVLLPEYREDFIQLLNGLNIKKEHKR